MEREQSDSGLEIVVLPLYSQFEAWKFADGARKLLWDVIGNPALEEIARRHLVNAAAIPDYKPKPEGYDFQKEGDELLGLVDTAIEKNKFTFARRVVSLARVLYGHVEPQNPNNPILLEIARGDIAYGLDRRRKAVEHYQHARQILHETRKTGRRAPRHLPYAVSYLAVLMFTDASLHPSDYLVDKFGSKIHREYEQFKDRPLKNPRPTPARPTRAPTVNNPPKPPPPR